MSATSTARYRLRTAKAMADAEAATREAIQAVGWLGEWDPAFLESDHAAEDVEWLLQRAARDLRCAMAVLNNTTLGGGS